ncbi:MAG: MarR family transcriptional regulator [Alphaproteobacteria bacterium]|nr:MarR family transcriptional regulator [Alphaproteobacteria bacterium]
MTDAAFEKRVAALRRFNRFYTQKIGVLGEGLLQSPFPLTEARVIYELAQVKDTSASRIARDLGLDAGYLSRILRRFERGGLIRRRVAAEDRRRTLLSLTTKGRRAFAALDRRSREENAGLLRPLPEASQKELAEAMERIERLLGGDQAASRQGRRPSFILRPHRAGDIGWVVHRHGVLYQREYGFDATFEALVAEIGAGFLRRFDPARECCWIAESDGRILGSAFVVRQSRRVAKLRLVYVEPEARGLGIGRALLDACIAFARAAGYRTMTLWTNDVLTAARQLYERAGFRLVARERHHSFGQDLMGENWDLDL